MNTEIILRGSPLELLGYNTGVGIKLNIKDLKKKVKKNRFEFAFIGGKDPDLIESLEAVDVNSPDANLNATSISDNRGGRIELNEDDDKIVKK